MKESKNPSNNNRLKGINNEEVALQYLLSLDFILIERNFFSRYGEIDLIMKKDDILHFIEVKSGNTFYPLHNITPKKLNNIINTIHAFLDKNKLALDFCVDAIAIHNGEIIFVQNITL